MKKEKKYFIILPLFLWMLVLFIRSGIHLIRIYKEFTKPVEGYYQDVTTCGKDNFESFEKQRLYNYLNLGEKCEK